MCSPQKKAESDRGMGNFIQSLPDVITVSSTKKSAESIKDFKNAVNAANRNASAGIATEVEQAVKEGGNVLINMVNQHCYFDECTNTETLVGRRGCADYSSSNANDCAAFCAKQRANCADPNTCPPCDCPDAETCEKPILDIMWDKECRKKTSKTQCEAQVSQCQWEGGACMKKTVCSQVYRRENSTWAGGKCSDPRFTDQEACEANIEVTNTGTGCNPPPDTNKIINTSLMRACYGVDSDAHRGCIHGDLDDPTAPTVRMGCLGLCEKGAANCPADCEPLAKNPAPGTAGFARLRVCQDWYKDNYPEKALRGTEEDKRLLDYYNSLALALSPEESDTDARSVIMTNACSVIGNDDATCSANPDCKWNNASLRCEPDSTAVQIQIDRLNRKIDKTVADNTRKACGERVCMDTSRSGFKKVCKRILSEGTETAQDAQDCPAGYASLPIDEDGIQHDSPPCDEGAQCTVCSGYTLTPGATACAGRAQADCNKDCHWNTQMDACEDCLLLGSYKGSTRVYDNAGNEIRKDNGALLRVNPGNELKEMKSTKMSYSGQCVIRNIKQDNTMETGTEAQHMRNIDKSLQNVDLAIVRQAMRGIGASVIGGFNQDKFSTAENIASATQRASIEITNKAKQDCGVSTDNKKVLMNLVNQDCRNTRRCVIEDVEQTNKLSAEMESCVQKLTMNSTALQSMGQQIEQLAVGNPTLTMKKPLINTIVWTAVAAGILGAFSLWVVSGMVPAVIVSIFAAAVAAGVGFYIWYPSQKGAQTDAFLLYGSVERSAGQINDQTYHPMKQCGVDPYRTSARFNNMEMAAKACRGDDKCRSFYFATFADNATTSTVECAGKGRGECGDGCNWIQSNQWMPDRERGVLCSDNESRDRASCEAGGGTWAGKCSNPAFTDEASCDGFWMPEPDDLGTCTNSSLKGKAVCEAPGVCTANPTTGRVYVDTSTETCGDAKCPTRCRGNPDFPGCEKCCEEGCVAHVEFVGRYRQLKCSKCTPRKGLGWFYDVDLNNMGTCVGDPSKNNKKDECEKAEREFRACTDGILQPELVTDDQLRCFHRVPRWMGVQVPRYPYAEGGKALMTEAIGWGLGVAAAIVLVHFLLSATPGLNKFLKLGPHA